jgi:hypothetical protein
MSVILARRKNFSGRTAQLIADLRMYLADLDPNCVVYSECRLEMFLRRAMQDINIEPHRTFYTLENVPVDWEVVILQGAALFSLFSQGIFEAYREFAVAGTSVSYNPPQLAAVLDSRHSGILQEYIENKRRVKQSSFVAPIGLGSFGGTFKGTLFPRTSALKNIRGGSWLRTSRR